MNRKIKPRPSPSPAKQITTFIAKFDPPLAKLIRSCRAKLRQRFPTAIEQVYDNYNFLVFGFCSTERTSTAIVSLAAHAQGVSLCFYYGATLSDPHKLLQGSGKQTRFLRLPTAATLNSSKVESLLRAAITQAKSPLPKTGRGQTLIKSISTKQRSRRAASK